MNQENMHFAIKYIYIFWYTELYYKLEYTWLWLLHYMKHIAIQCTIILILIIILMCILKIILNSHIYIHKQMATPKCCFRESLEEAYYQTITIWHFKFRMWLIRHAIQELLCKSNARTASFRNNDLPGGVRRVSHVEVITQNSPVWGSHSAHL